MFFHRKDHSDVSNQLYACYAIGKDVQARYLMFFEIISFIQSSYHNLRCQMEMHGWDVLCRPWKQLLVRKLWHQMTCSIWSSLASLRRTSLPRWKTHDLCLLYKFLFSWICLKFTRGLVLIFCNLSFIFAGQLWEPHCLWVSGHWMAASQVINLNKWSFTSWDHDFFSESSPRRCWRGSQPQFWPSSTPVTPATKLVSSSHE